MPRGIPKKDQSEKEQEGFDEDTPPTETGEVSQETTNFSAPVKTVFEVIANDGGVVRIYSFEDHGENAEALAQKFAGKRGYKVR